MKPSAISKHTLSSSFFHSNQWSCHENVSSRTIDGLPPPKDHIISLTRFNHSIFPCSLKAATFLQAKWRLTSLSKSAASLGSVESNSIFGASKENLTRSGSQRCCIFPVKEIVFFYHPFKFKTSSSCVSNPQKHHQAQRLLDLLGCWSLQSQIQYVWRNRNGHGPPESKVPECLWSRSSIDPSAFAKNNESCVWKFE